MKVEDCQEGMWITTLGRPYPDEDDVEPSTYCVDHINRNFIFLKEKALSIRGKLVNGITLHEFQYARPATDKEILIAKLKQ